MTISLRSVVASYENAYPTPNRAIIDTIRCLYWYVTLDIPIAVDAEVSLNPVFTTWKMRVKIYN